MLLLFSVLLPPELKLAKWFFFVFLLFTFLTTLTILQLAWLSNNSVAYHHYDHINGKIIAIKYSQTATHHSWVSPKTFGCLCWIIWWWMIIMGLPLSQLNLLTMMQQYFNDAKGSNIHRHAYGCHLQIVLTSDLNINHSLTENFLLV